MLIPGDPFHAVTLQKYFMHISYFHIWKKEFLLFHIFYYVNLFYSFDAWLHIDFLKLAGKSRVMKFIFRYIAGKCCYFLELWEEVMCSGVVNDASEVDNIFSLNFSIIHFSRRSCLLLTFPLSENLIWLCMIIKRITLKVDHFAVLSLANFHFLDWFHKI